MKHFYKLLSAVFLLPFFSTAQTNYQPGYVVTLKGDTLHGFIDYREWNKNPKDIHFKSSQNSEKAEDFSSENAAAFAITGFEYYKRFILSISQDAVDIGKLETKPDTSSLTDAVFLRVITKGEHLTLYSYTDNIKSRFYISEAGNMQPQELIYHAYYNPEAATSVQYINRYRTQLENLAQKYNINSDKINEQILQATYTETEMTKIVQAINGTSSQQFTPKDPSGIRWFAGIGANYSSLKFEGTGIVFAGQKPVSSVFPKITGGLDFISNKNTQRVLFRLELSFTMNQFKLSGKSDESAPQSSNTLNLTQYNSALTPQVIFNIYNGQQLKLFIDGGVSFNLSAYNNYASVTYYPSFPSLKIGKYPDFHQFYISLPIRAGLVLNKKIEVNICYIPPYAVSNYTNFSASITSYQVGVNYFFGKK